MPLHLPPVWALAFTAFLSSKVFFPKASTSSPMREGELGDPEGCGLGKGFNQSPRPYQDFQEGSLQTAWVWGLPGGPQPLPPGQPPPSETWRLVSWRAQEDGEVEEGQAALLGL